MKKLLALFMTLILTLSFSACGNYVLSQTLSISREEALEIALKKAGVPEMDIRDVDVELDRELGATVWEVNFEHGRLEYSYDVNAKTGKIRKVERERDY